MRKCSYCGNILLENSDICLNCGCITRSLFRVCLTRGKQFGIVNPAAKVIFETTGFDRVVSVKRGETVETMLPPGDYHVTITWSGHTAEYNISVNRDIHYIVDPDQWSTRISFFEKI